MSRIQEVKAALLAGNTLERLVKDLTPGGVRRGSVWQTKNPARNDRKPGSFVVWLQGAARGGWKDYASGEKGDVLDLICLAQGLDKKEALKWAEDRVGFRRLSPKERKSLVREAVKRDAAHKKQAEAQERQKVYRARVAWSKALPIEGTAGDAYFAWRGVPLAAIRNRMDFCRFVPALEYWLEAEFAYGEDGRRRKVKAGRSFPCILSRMDDLNGNIRALHYTFVAENGQGKAPVADQTKAKLMYPRTTGSMIWLTRGRGNLNPDTAADLGRTAPAIGGEGIEDGLSSALALPEIRHFAAGALSNLRSIPLLPCVSGYVLLRDNDWHNDQAADQFSKAMARIADAGLPVGEASASRGKDFNDMVKGERDDG